jgi:hypothetical protein
VSGGERERGWGREPKSNGRKTYFNHHRTFARFYLCLQKYQNMGAAVSLIAKTSAVAHPEVFVSLALLDGFKHLQGSASLRKSFVEFIKSGVWMDKIARYTSDQRPARQKQETLGEEETFSQSAGPSATEKTELTTRFESSFKQKQGCAVLEGYTGIADQCFTSTQLCCFLFAMVWPIYAASSAFRMHIKYGPKAALHCEEDNHSVTSVPEVGKVQTPQSARVQEILLGCAAYIDEGPMMELLQTEWVTTLTTAMSSHAVAISVVHHTKPDQPIAYANRSFGALCCSTKTGAIVGESIHSVSGKQPALKKKKLLDAFKAPHYSKLFFPRYTSNSRCLLDGTAVQPVGDYALCAHFTAHPGAIDAAQISVR